MRFVLALYKKRFANKITLKPEEMFETGAQLEKAVETVRKDVWIYTLENNTILPSKDCLELRGKNLAFQLKIWTQATLPSIEIPDPMTHGWEKHDEGVKLIPDSKENMQKNDNIFKTIMRKCKCKKTVQEWSMCLLQWKTELFKLLRMWKLLQSIFPWHSQRRRPWSVRIRGWLRWRRQCSRKWFRSGERRRISEKLNYSLLRIFFSNWDNFDKNNLYFGVRVVMKWVYQAQYKASDTSSRPWNTSTWLSLVTAEYNLQAKFSWAQKMCLFDETWLILFRILQYPKILNWGKNFFLQNRCFSKKNFTTKSCGIWLKLGGDLVPHPT